MANPGTLVTLLGGPFHGFKVELTETPYLISAGAHSYSQIVNPDSGEFLGAYVYEEAKALQVPGQLG